jgi:hypothetical protein
MPSWTVTWPNEETRLRARLRDLEPAFRRAKRGLLLHIGLVALLFVTIVVYVLGLDAGYWFLSSSLVNWITGLSAALLGWQLGGALLEFRAAKKVFEDVLYALEKEKWAGRS